MRLEFSTQSEAQAKADEIHARMIAADPAYAAGAAAGQTTAWAIPYQDFELDKDGNPTGRVLSPSWWINLKPRADKVLTSREVADLKAYRPKNG